MKREELMAKEIEELRTGLEKTINERNKLTDPEVLKASQLVDQILIQYYRKLGMQLRTHTS